MNRFLPFLFAAVFAVGLTLVATRPASAHQPFFEDTPFGADNPFVVRDPSVSTAVYATLDTPTDTDYYVFEVAKGQEPVFDVISSREAAATSFHPQMALYRLAPSWFNTARAERIAFTKRQLRGPALAHLRAERARLDAEIARTWMSPQTMAAVRAYVEKTLTKR